MSFLTRILWVCFLAAMPFVMCGFGPALWRVVNGMSGHNPHVWAGGVGAALFAVVYYLTRRWLHRPWHYLATLEHELTHAFIGLLFGKIPVSLRASAYQGGEVVLRNGSNVWISLAPYYFPTLSILALLLNYLFAPQAATFYALLGATVAFHLLTTWQETSFRQPDLQQAGLIASCLILPVMNLLCYGTILSFMAGGRTGLSSFWWQGWRNTAAAVWSLWAAVT